VLLLKVLCFQYGNICLDILKEKWSALYEVRTILLSIQTLLGKPFQKDDLGSRVARWYIFKPKIQIWVNFGWPWNGKVFFTFFYGDQRYRSP
jgi:hypothetical protein